MMNRILLCLLSASMIIGNICAWTQEDYRRASQRYNYSKTQFDADMERLSKDNPEFTAKFNEQKANFGEKARSSALFSIFYTPRAVTMAAAGALGGALVGNLLDDKKAIGATLGGVIGMVTGGYDSIDERLPFVLDEERWYKLKYGEESPETMATIWAKNNTWETLFTSSENSTKTLAYNNHLAKLKKAMQENPQFEEDFMRRVKLGGKAARHDATKTAIAGAKFGAKYGAIGGAVVGAIAAHVIARNTSISCDGLSVACSAKIAVPIGATIGSALGAATGAAVCAPIGAIAGTVGTLDWGCEDCGRKFNRGDTNHDESIQHDQKELLDANLAARRWVSDHKFRTLFTLISDKPARNALHAELDRVNPADFGL